MLTPKEFMIAYITEVVEKVRELSGEKPELEKLIDDYVQHNMELVDNLVSQEIDIAYTEKKEPKIAFCKTILDKKEKYPDFPTAFKSSFKSRTEYLNLIHHISEAELRLSDLHRQFAETLNRARENIGNEYLLPPPLRERYSEYTWNYELIEAGKEEDRIKGDLSDVITNPSRTVFGRKPPAESKIPPVDNERVSGEHGYFYFDEAGNFGYVDKSVYRSSCTDWSRKDIYITQKSHGTETEVFTILFPKDFDEPKGTVSIFFGGKFGRLYELKITLQKKQTTNNT